ncbi:uncharacterized protein G2W53_025436 [Senna tora]|uniref:Uncharacterized protein n=1 Tax=Senna tora TaxID=362788 RepID=A0A834WHW5_9FABA|nr:uncharacterized protein G2W53_025436 [Senna tora]
MATLIIVHKKQRQPSSVLTSGRICFFTFLPSFSGFLAPPLTRQSSPNKRPVRNTRVLMVV